MLKIVYLKSYSYIVTSEDTKKIEYDIFMNVSLSQFSPISCFTRRILQRQTAVKDLYLLILSNLFFLHFLYVTLINVVTLFLVTVTLNIKPVFK